VTAEGRQRHLSVLVPSRGAPGTFWTVKLTSKGWVCTGGDGDRGCKFWQFSVQQGTFEPCRHILDVKDSIRRGALLDSNGRAITSMLAFRDLIESGVFGEDCLDVLMIVRQCPNVCDHEIQRIWNAQQRRKRRPLKAISSVTARRNWLMNAGFIENGSKKKWRPTGMSVNCWRVAF